MLLIEDDELIGRHLQRGLGGAGYPTVWCRSGRAGVIEVRERHAGVVILDLGLPDLDGIEVARAIRSADPDALIIILTARGGEIDVVIGLDAGADDYLLKPVTITVLLARIRAHLRRRPSLNLEAADLHLGDMCLQLAARRCLCRDEEIRMRPKEFDLLAALATSPGVAVSRSELMRQVWDENWYGSTKTLDVTMAALRRKLLAASRHSSNPKPELPTITTLRNHGYRLDPPLDVEESRT